MRETEPSRVCQARNRSLPLASHADLGDSPWDYNFRFHQNTDWHWPSDYNNFRFQNGSLDYIPHHNLVARCWYAGPTDVQSRPRHWPLARQLFSPSLASRASGSSSPLAQKGQWPSVRTTRCLFCAGPKRKSDLRIKSKTMRKSDLSRRIHLFSVIRPTPFISGFPSLGHPSPDSGKQQWLYPALSDRRVCDRDSLCFGSFREWHYVRARKFCRPRRPIVVRGRADWLSERELFRIRFRNASLLLMLRLAKMFEKHSKHMEGNY